ncbi:tyrosine-protein kinase receptor TYRO3-like [Coregonus clupeaformis]|uniref:tyrosine-protein kinase receptor TYRO3-like n=1 Tax=Coregonus clupeaformis TaxID=59861 RepID=UPI001E1C412E|nr:tyrosine-protein kinase receptor TYRO3-like [Coregonus clupeaformis]
MDIKVAVKTMRVGLHSQEDLDSFLKEAEIMQHFDHNNVVKLLGVTLQQEQDSPLPVPLVILPFMKHGDLRRFLIAARYGDIPMFVPHQSLLRFMVDIAAGMEYLSSQGFCTGTWLHATACWGTTCVCVWLTSASPRRYTATTTTDRQWLSACQSSGWP